MKNNVLPHPSSNMVNCTLLDITKNSLNTEFEYKFNKDEHLKLNKYSNLSCLDVNTNGELITIGSSYTGRFWDGIVISMNIKDSYDNSNTIVSQQTKIESSSNSIKWINDSVFAIGLHNGHLNVWSQLKDSNDYNKGYLTTKLSTIPLHDGLCNSITVEQSNKNLFTAGDDGCINQLNLEYNQVTCRFPIHYQSITSIDSKNNIIASSSIDGMLLITDVRNHHRPCKIINNNNDKQNIDLKILLNNDSSMIYAVNEANQIHSYDLRNPSNHVLLTNTVKNLSTFCINDQNELLFFDQVNKKIHKMSNNLLEESMKLHNLQSVNDCVYDPINKSIHMVGEEFSIQTVSNLLFNKDQ